MTNEEAYDLIELCLDYDKDMSEHPERYDMALRIARKALLREIPLKPFYDHLNTAMRCTFCGNMVSGWEESPNYCPQCGQAIDWSE